MEVASLKQGEWLSYRGGQFNGGSVVILQRWPFHWRENGHFTEVLILMEGERSCYGGGRENGHVLEVTLMEKNCQRISLMEREW